MEFHWSYLIVGAIILFFLMGKGKGGVVVTRFTADFDILDARFESSKPEADYTTFKPGTPDHLDIEIKKLPLDVGEKIIFKINGAQLAKVAVKRNKEAEFDHWSDEEIQFPSIKKGDVLLVEYQGKDILRGKF